MRRSVLTVPVRTVEKNCTTGRQDYIAVEEPLEIRINGATLAVAMRTPGADRELAAGFLLSEGIIGGAADVKTIESRDGVVDVWLQPGVDLDRDLFGRGTVINSSCGVCGKVSLENLNTRGAAALPHDGFRVRSQTIHDLPAVLRERQDVFERTGGLHAAALFDASGKLVSVREDIGRHNALDKLIGERLLSGALPLRECMVLVSGRAGFELIQKCVMAGVPALAAVGAPSSLAVDAARRFALTLLGFVRNERFNIYSGEWRVV